MKQEKIDNYVEIVTIILTVVAVVLVFYVVHTKICNESNETEFIIYREVCHNKTYIIGYFEYPEFDGNISIFPDFDINFTIQSTCSSCAIPIINSEENIVEFIRFDKIKNIRKYEDKIIGDVEDCNQIQVNGTGVLGLCWEANITNEEFNKCTLDENNVIKELSINFLDNNCLLKEKLINSQCDNGKCGMNNLIVFAKYQCGEYIVEVKNE